MDVRDNNDKAWVTDPIILENDIQASMAYADYQKQLIKNHVLITDLRLYRIAYYDNDDVQKPIIIEPEPYEIPVNLVGGEENE